MNRRTFFSRIGCAVVGCYLALNVPSIRDEVRTVKRVLVGPNPAYIKAPYEVYCTRTVNIYGRVYDRPHVVNRTTEFSPNAWNSYEPFPFRFNEDPGPDQTKWRKKAIPPFIELQEI